jgi:polyisoprenyl-phosphate glycosyltransferase
MTTPSTSFVSVVAVVADDGPQIRVADFAAETLRVLAATTPDHELILVDDGADRATAAACDRVVAEHECVRLIRLSRRHGADVAVTAGLDSAIGDLTADVVIGTTGRRGRSWLRRAAWRAFHRVFRRMSGFRLVPGASTMRLFNRRALNALTRNRQKTVHLRLLGCSVGFRTAAIDYEPTAPLRVSPWLATAGEAVSMLVTHSPAPLRIVSYLGGIASLLNVACMAWVVAANLWKDHVVEGWTTLSLQLAIMFFFLFTTLIVIAEYLAHAFEEVKDCPLYHVAEERTGSTAVSDARKRNISVIAADPREESDEPHRIRRRTA